MSTFDRAWADLLGNEGGYSNNPSDPGGETNWGVTARVARAHGYTGPMRDLPEATAKQIAKVEYWDRFQCDQLSDVLAFQVLDAAYNGGFPVQWLQRAAGVAEDGQLGPETLTALHEADQDKLCMRFDAYRLQYMAWLKIWPTFGRGWANRIASNLLRAGA